MNRTYSKYCLLFVLSLFFSAEIGCANNQNTKKTAKKNQPKKDTKKIMHRIGDTVIIHHIQGEDDLKNALSIASGKKLPLLIKVYLSGCPACEHVKPLFNEVAKEQSGKALFLAIDAGSSANSKFMDIFAIGAVPTFIALDHKALGKKSDLASLKKAGTVKTGALSKTEITKLVGAHKKAAKKVA